MQGQNNKKEKHKDKPHYQRVLAKRMEPIQIFHPFLALMALFVLLPAV